MKKSLLTVALVSTLIGGFVSQLYSFPHFSEINASSSHSEPNIFERSGILYSIDKESGTSSIIGYNENIEGSVTLLDSVYDSSWKFYPVTKISKSAFKRCKDIVSVTIPESVTDIEDDAFSGCSLLNEIYFSGNSKLKGIGVKSFANTGLISVSIPNSVSTIGSWAFSNCMYLEDLSIFNNDVTFGTGVFNNCRKLNKIHVPCAFDINKFKNSGINLINSTKDPKNGCDYNVTGCSSSVFGLMTDKVVGSGNIILDHDFPSKRCASCNYMET